MATRCPKCQTENPETARFCLDCGTQISPAKKIPPLTETIRTPGCGLAPKSLLGTRYEILEKIGAGGMGEVYSALDKPLDRQVAIKVLPEEFVEDLERVARFEREAKLLGSLNHPNIAIVHGFEEAMGKRFLVLELVEGETLAQRISRGALPVDDSLDVSRQIAEGLEAAHGKGIIHRDLKPGNVKITPDGKVKILDFGLAKAFRGLESNAGLALSPTITDQMTQPGVVLGTAAYMSPEQAKGKPVDKRADIWAFGCILYECLAGKKPFERESVTDILAKILEGEPDWARLPAGTPPVLRSLLRRCLQKDRNKRQHDMSDVRIEIEEATVSLGEKEQFLPDKPRSSKWRIPLIGISVAVGAILGGLAIWKLKPVSVPRQVVRFPLALPADQQFSVP